MTNNDSARNYSRKVRYLTAACMGELADTWVLTQSSIVQARFLKEDDRIFVIGTLEECRAAVERSNAFERCLWRDQRA